MKKLLNIFKSAARNDVAVVEHKGKSTEELIEEIHESFYTEVDKLLAEANVSNSLETDKQSLIDKCQRLRALGFTQTPEIVEAEKEIERLKALKKENEAKSDLIKAINYFSFKYPNYKFIAEDSVKKICQKYGLIYGPITLFRGVVPDKNLKHIEDFKVDEYDECYAVMRNNRFTRGSYIAEYISKPKPIIRAAKDTLARIEDYVYWNPYRNSDTIVQSPLEIAAPSKDFDTENMVVSNFQLAKLEIPDPVVLKPVIYNQNKYYLIVTAWGLEASDELVVNQKMN